MRRGSDSIGKDILAVIGAVVVMGGYAALLFAVQVVLAQVEVFGLSDFHVNSGIGGPLLLNMVASIIIGGSVATGVRRALKNR